MMRLADAIAENAEAIARVETRDNGKLYKEMLGQLRIVPEWLYYFGGLADKVEGRVIPLDRLERLQLHAARAARRRRRHHALELAGAARSCARWRRRWRPATPSWSSRRSTPAASVLETCALAEQVGIPPA